MLDIDDQIVDSARDWRIENIASRISHRWDLGDCLVILSSFDGDSLNYHLVYDRIMPWLQIHRIILKLAREGKIDSNLKRLSMGRGDMTLRLSPDRANDRMAPFPIGYVRCSGSRERPWETRKGYHGGGINKWLEAWKIAKNISNISSLPSQAPRIAQK